MFNIGTGEMAVILVAALLLLGPERLPELARGLGKFLREFRRQTDEVRGMVEREFYRMDQDLKAVASLEEPAPAAAPAVAAAAPAPAEMAPAVAPAAAAVLGLPLPKPPEGAVAREVKPRPVPSTPKDGPHGG